MKILIVGLGRSGTTLTYRILNNNPEVKKSFLEHCILQFHDSAKSLKKKEPCFNGTCCEKINYTTDKLVRNVHPHHGEVDISIDKYCEKWLDWFGSEARIIHIIRHPLDGIFSFIAKRGRKMKLYKGHQIDMVPEHIQQKMIKQYLRVCPSYPEKIAALPNTFTINYENLIMKPNMIKRAYTFCGLPNVPFTEGLRTARVFGHSESGFQIDQPIDHILKIYNRIGEVTYK